MSIGRKLWSNKYIKNLVLMLLASVALFILVALFIRFYTNHGQKLILPDYIGMNYHDAVDLASTNNFELIVDDSVHIVGKPGGEILAQNPDPESGVKEGRKVYVTVAKYNPDKFLSSQLPVLYGKRFDHKVKELSTIFKLDCQVIGHQYDPGPEDHILEVRYNGKPIENKKGKNSKVEIARGDRLEFILSSKDGGKATIPDVVCQTLESARFIVATSKMKMGSITHSGEILDEGAAYVIGQTPVADGSKIDMGSPINVTIVQDKPENCQ